MTFLRDHVTEYSSAVGLQERAKVAVKFANLGIEPRFDASQTLTRTVVLPQDGEAGRVTYTLSGNLQASTKEKLTIGKQQLDQLEIGYVPQNIVDHGQISGEVSLTWELPASSFDTSLSGQPAPELGALIDGNLPDAPAEISARLRINYQTQSLLDLSRTDQQRLTFQLRSDNPASVAPAVGDLLHGDLESALRGLGDEAKLTVTNEAIRRDGVNQQHEVGVEFADIIEGKVSLIGNIGLDDITQRRTAAFTGTELAERLFGADRGSAVADPSRSSGESDTLVVVPHNGLNVREAPSADSAKISAFQNGTFVTPTGQEAQDAGGRGWVEVSGLDANDRIVTGWVAAEHVRPHEQGAMDEQGRINPELEERGFTAHTVAEGDTMWDLARRDGVNFRDMLELNRDHLIDPNLIFPGDTVYIPGTGQPVQPVIEPTPSASTPPSNPPVTPPAPRSNSLARQQRTGPVSMASCAITRWSTIRAA
ncbi:MAG: LysM peptidoglycan-binding domain-containing protein [Rhodomicrobium sp.]|nr:LysM peptidoglycan-binding domain-containing protein [Rhodomicrobium sp.]